MIIERHSPVYGIVFALLALVFACTSCLNGLGVGQRNDLRVDTEYFPADVHDVEVLNVGGNGTVINSGLALAVRVEVQGRWEIDESPLRVDDAGDIRLPLIGSIRAGGLTLNALGDRLAEKYAEYFVNPRVSVDFVLDGRDGVSPWGSVTVLGRVNKPGVIALPPTQKMSVVAAIQAAGGFDTSANQRAIRITGEDSVSRRVDLRQLGRSGSLREDIFLEKGDVVYVPEQFF